MLLRPFATTGLVFALAACALWGAIFMVPVLLPDFTPLQITFGRFVMYGAVAFLAFVPQAGSLLARMRAVDLLRLAWLALTGNLVYFALVASAVQSVGVAVTSLIVGLVPMVVPVLGRKTAGALPLRQLLLPVAVIMVGVLAINARALLGSTTAATPMQYALGVAMAVLALLCWSRYALDNTRYLADSAFSGAQWTTLWGLVVGLISALLWLLMIGLGLEPPHQASAERWQFFWLLNLAVAVLCSWLGNWMWNAASQRLPITLAGQLLVFETLFALFYHFAYERRWPDLVELAAMALILGGIAASLQRFRRSTRV